MRADRSGPLRLGDIVKIDPPTPIATLPAIAMISAFLAKRPAWAQRDPFSIPRDLFEDGEAEMRQHMKKRGFALPVSAELARDGVRNFMINGVAIVIEGA